SMLEELSKDYVRTARAKGLSNYQVVYKHAGKNAIIPVITLAGIQFIRLLGGYEILELARTGITSLQRGSDGVLYL
ncbi:MAG: ABC transporter permease subunit, partial [Lachnospiraceae bacterium]|nr:ABC transporter permease subunit [Lachnospiraceae bacterium]